MSTSSGRPPAMSRKSMVASGVSFACLAYAASLALQRVFPWIENALALTLAEGVQPTYYLRVASSLLIGALAGGLVRRPVPERWLAWGTALAAGAAVVLVCAFP